MTITIDNKLYNDILQWCESNNLEPLKYIEKTLRERLATDKYGDLNEKLRDFVKPETKTVVEIPNAVEAEISPEPIVSYKSDADSKHEPSESDNSNNEEQLENKKTKRTLKTK